VPREAPKTAVFPQLSNERILTVRLRDAARPLPHTDTTRRYS
jgi:hypothetical protein